jgi:hypothetical protein
MSYPPANLPDHAIDQQTRFIRGLMAALYASHDADPDESLLQELTEAKKTLSGLQACVHLTPSHSAG